VATFRRWWEPDGGVGALAGRPVDRDSGMVAALEAGLVRLLEEYDLPQADRAQLEAALQCLRDAWSRGNACL
jgi:hypothetical protein